MTINLEELEAAIEYMSDAPWNVRECEGSAAKHARNIYKAAKEYARIKLKWDKMKAVSKEYELAKHEYVRPVIHIPIRPKDTAARDRLAVAEVVLKTTCVNALKED